MRAPTIALTFVAVIAGTALAEDLYDLRGPAPEKGQIYLITAKSVGKNMTKTTKTQDKTNEERFEENNYKKKEVEILAVQGDEITRMRSKIIQDQREYIMRKGKKGARRNIDGDLHGQFIYSERLKSGWKNSLEDVAPTDKQLRELKEYVPFKEEDLFYPKEKTKVGHTWKIDPALMEKVIGRQMEDFKGTGAGKFLRVEKGDGEDIAVLEVEQEWTGKSKDDDGTMEFKIKAKGTVHRSLKYGFDRKSAMVVQLSMKGDGEIDGEKAEVELNGTTNDEDLIELKKR